GERAAGVPWRRHRMTGEAMRKIRSAVVVLGLLWSVGLLGMLGRAGAQSPNEERTYGTAPEIAHVMSAWEFEQTLATGTVNSTLLGGFQRYCSSDFCPLAAGVRLPGGALVSRFEVDGCNDSNTDILSFSMVRTPAGGGPPLSDANLLTPDVQIGKV